MSIAGKVFGVSRAGEHGHPTSLPCTGGRATYGHRMKRLAMALLLPLVLMGCTDGGPEGASGSLTVEVANLDPNGGDYKVDFTPDPGAVGMVTRLESGYRYAQVAAGEYTVSVTQGDRRASEEVVVNADEDNSVEVRLP